MGPTFYLQHILSSKIFDSNKTLNLDGLKKRFSTAKTFVSDGDVLTRGIVVRPLDDKGLGSSLHLLFKVLLGSGSRSHIV